jgi:hypothetical protein
MRAVALLALLAAAGCGGGGSGVTVTEVPPQDLPPSPTPSVQPTPVAAPAFMRSGDEWAGTYTCAQGRTDLVLHVERVMGSHVEAVFEFLHGPSNAGGSYRMRGTLNDDGTVRLIPGAWIDQPPGYVTVGMSGRVQGDAFTGRIDNPSCGTFSVRRR